MAQQSTQQTQTGVKREERAGQRLGVKNPEAVVEHLNRILADEFVLYTKTRNYHWNVVGRRFSELHEFFEKQYKTLEGYIDDVAERARTVGGRAAASMKEYLELTRLKEDPGQKTPPDADTMISNLLRDHETVINHLRDDARVVDELHNDEGTNGFLVDMMAKHEKTAWMLRAHLEGGA